MVDLICEGLLELQGALSGNYEMEKNPVHSATRTHDPWIAKLICPML